MTAPVQDYQSQTEALATATAATAVNILADYAAGHIAAAEVAALIAAVINTGNAAASTLADAYVSAHIEHMAGVPTPAIGVPPADDTARLVSVVDGILADRDDDQDTAAMRIKRLAHSEPLQAAQESTIKAIAAQPEVIGWRRQMDADPCELCQWWWAGGRIYKPTTVFRQHPGCNCQPQPVIREEKTA